MDFQGIVILFLMQLPALGGGFIAGMLFMRGNYLRLLRQERVKVSRAMRYVETRAKNERMMGYVVGFREGSKN